MLVHADSAAEPFRQRQAIDLIKHHRSQGSAVLAKQVLQEYANVALRKLGLPMPLLRSRPDFCSRFERVPTTPALISGALDLHALHGLAFYDAMIVQAVMASGCAQLLTEDMQPGATLGGDGVINPFVAPA